MKIFHVAALAATIGLVLQASPALAQNGRCEFQPSAAVTASNPEGDTLTNSVAVARVIASAEGQRRLAGSPAECQGSVAEATLRASGLVGDAAFVSGTPISIAVPILFTPAPAQPAAEQPPAVPANTGAAGPGAQIDLQIADHERRIAALEVGGGDSTEIAALRADLASLRAEQRAQATQSPPRNTTVVRRETQVINQGLNAADRSELDLWTRSRQGFSNAMNRLFGTGPDNPQTEVREDGIIGGLQAADADLARRVSALEAKESWLTPKWWWFAILFVIGLLTAMWLASRKPQTKEVNLTGYAKKGDLQGLATNDELAREVAGIQVRTDRVAGDVQLDLSSADKLKKAKVGEGVEVTATVDDVPTYTGLTFTKLDNGNFALGQDIGDSKAGQEVGNVLTFIRKAHKARRNSLEPFLIKTT